MGTAEPVLECPVAQYPWRYAIRLSRYRQLNQLVLRTVKLRPVRHVWTLHQPEVIAHGGYGYVPGTTHDLDALLYGAQVTIDVILRQSACHSGVQEWIVAADASRAAPVEHAAETHLPCLYAVSAVHVSAVITAFAYTEL